MSILTTILQEVTQGRFDTILRVKEEYNDGWWFHIDLFHQELIRQPTRIDLLDRLFCYLKHPEYKRILRAILQANRLTLLSYWRNDPFQLPYLTQDYHYIYILFESLRLQHASGIKLAQQKLEWRPAMKAVVSFKIVRILFHENDPDLVIIFMNYIKQTLDHDVYISIRGEILEYQLWNEDSVHSNIQAFQTTFLCHQGFTKLIEAMKQEQETYEVFILDVYYQTREQNEEPRASYLILEATLHDKLLAHILKYIVKSYVV